MADRKEESVVHAPRLTLDALPVSSLLPSRDEQCQRSLPTIAARSQSVLPRWNANRVVCRRQNTRVGTTPHPNRGFQRPRSVPRWLGDIAQFCPTLYSLRQPLEKVQWFRSKTRPAKHFHRGLLFPLGSSRRSNRNSQSAAVH